MAMMKSLTIGNFTGEIPSKTSDLTNDSGFVDAAGAAAAAPVQSVNGQTGDVVLDADDVGAATAADIQTAIANKADADGTYPDMTVGSAEQLTLEDAAEDSEPYLFRTSGGSAVIGDKETYTIVGGTLAWNQLSSETAPVTVQANAGSQNVFLGNFNSVLGHKYFVACRQQNSMTSNLRNFFSINFNGTNDYEYSGLQNLNLAAGRYCCILACTSTYGNSSAYRWCHTLSDATTFSDFVISDLTADLGPTIADYAYSLEQNEHGTGTAWLQKYFPKMFSAYRSYDQGSLVSVKTSAHETVGFNAWDEETADGYWENSGPNANPSYLRSKNMIKVIPGATYYFNFPPRVTSLYTKGYDANGTNAISLTIAPRTAFTIPANVHYIGIAVNKNQYGNTYTNDICINLSWSGARNGEYEPYVKHAYALDATLELRGIPKLDAGNRLYYDGDIYESDGTVTRKCGIRAYQAGDAADGSTMITDGTNTIYKLDTPTTETADPFENPQTVDNYGTEAYVDARTVPVPAGHVTAYNENMKIPTPPETAGTYTLQCTVAAKSKTYTWA